MTARTKRKVETQMRIKVLNENSHDKQIQRKSAMTIEGGVVYAMISMVIRQQSIEQVLL